MHTTLIKPLDHHCGDVPSTNGQANISPPTASLFKRCQAGTEVPVGSHPASTIPIALLLASILVSAGCLGLLEELADIEPRSYPASAQITVIREVYLNGSGPFSYTFDVPLPVNLTSGSTLIQSVERVTPSSGARLEDKDGISYLVWEESNIQQARITIEYTVRTQAMVWDVAPEEAGTIQDIPQVYKDRYLGEEWKIDPTPPQLRQLARNIAGGEDNVYTILRGVFDDMVARYDYDGESPAEPKEVLETITDGFGDCDDQAILFISLVRSLGVPAWLELGLVYGTRGAGWQGHGWVAAYLPLADGTGGVVNIDIVNSQFLFRDAFRITEFESDGNGDHLEDYYTTLNYRYNILDLTVDYTDEMSGPPVFSDDTIVLGGTLEEPTPSWVWIVLLMVTGAGIGLIANRILVSKLRNREGRD